MLKKQLSELTVDQGDTRENNSFEQQVYLSVASIRSVVAEVAVFTTIIKESFLVQSSFIPPIIQITSITFKS